MSGVQLITCSLASCLEREPLMLFLSCDKYKRKHQAKKKLYYAFVDLEKAFDRVPKRGGEMGFCGCWLWMNGSSAQFMALYTEAGLSESFEVKVGFASRGQY